MALRGSRIKNFDELWCVGASGGLEFCVSSTSFQKSNIGWPQQPPTEKVLKFNLIFHDSTKNKYFPKIKIKLNSRTWMTPKSSVVIFEPLETSAASLTSPASVASLASATSTAPIYSKNFLFLIIWSPLVPKWPTLALFCGISQEKSKFSLVSDTISVGGWWGQNM